MFHSNVVARRGTAGQGLVWQEHVRAVISRAAAVQSRVSLSVRRQGVEESC